MAVIPIQNYFNAELRILKFINNSSRFYPGMFFIASPDVEDRMKQLVDEKEQMLNVISDKTKENRHLKDELHKMVDVIAAEKNALSKVSAALTNLSRYEFPFCLFFVFVLHKILQMQLKILRNATYVFFSFRFFNYACHPAKLYKNVRNFNFSGPRREPGFDFKVRRIRPRNEQRNSRSTVQTHFREGFGNRITEAKVPNTVGCIASARTETRY